MKPLLGEVETRIIHALLRNSPSPAQLDEWDTDYPAKNPVPPAYYEALEDKEIKELEEGGWHDVDQIYTKEKQSSKTNLPKYLKKLCEKGILQVSSIKYGDVDRNIWRINRTLVVARTILAGIRQNPKIAKIPFTFNISKDNWELRAVRNNTSFEVDGKKYFTSSFFVQTQALRLWDAICIDGFLESDYFNSLPCQKAFLDELKNMYVIEERISSRIINRVKTQLNEVRAKSVRKT